MKIYALLAAGCLLSALSSGATAASAGYEEDYKAAKAACERKFNTKIFRVVITSDNRIICTIEDSQSAYGARGNHNQNGSSSIAGPTKVIGSGAGSSDLHRPPRGVNTVVGVPATTIGV